MVDRNAGRPGDGDIVVPDGSGVEEQGRTGGVVSSSSGREVVGDRRSSWSWQRYSGGMRMDPVTIGLVAFLSGGFLTGGAMYWVKVRNEAGDENASEIIASIGTLKSELESARALRPAT